MNVACDYEAPMQMLTTEKYIASGTPLSNSNLSTPRAEGPALYLIHKMPPLAQPQVHFAFV